MATHFKRAHSVFVSKALKANNPPTEYYVAIERQGSTGLYVSDKRSLTGSQGCCYICWDSSVCRQHWRFLAKQVMQKPRSLIVCVHNKLCCSCCYLDIWRIYRKRYRGRR